MFTVDGFVFKVLIAFKFGSFNGVIWALVVDPDLPIFYWNTLGVVFVVPASGRKRLLFRALAPGMSMVGDCFLKARGLFISLDFGKAFLSAGTTLLDLFAYYFLCNSDCFTVYGLFLDDSKLSSEF